MQFNQTMSASLAAIPDGGAGVFATLKEMRRFVRTYKTSLGIRNLAVQLTSNLSQKDRKGEIERLHAFVRDKIRYVRDIEDVETVQSPLVTLQLRAGDCDDKSVLLAALLSSIGYPTRFLALGFAKDSYEHVMVEVRLKNAWIPLETTEPVGIGWRPKNIAAQMYMFN